MSTTVKRLCVLASWSLVLGCSATDSRESGTAGRESSVSSCSEVLRIEGETWIQWPMQKRLDRDVVGSPIVALQDPCADPSSTSDRAEQPAEISLRRVEGFPDTSVLFREDLGYEDSIFVPGTHETTFEELPTEARRLIKSG